MSFKKAVYHITRAACSPTTNLRDVEKGQAIREKIVPHKVQPQGTSLSSAPLLDLQNTCLNKRCLIMGAAPTLWEIDISEIKVDFTFLLNRAFLFKGRPRTKREGLVLTNPLAFQEYGQEALNCELDFAFLSGAIDLGKHETDQRLAVVPQWTYPRIYDGFFQKNLQKPLYHGKSVAFTAIQIAAWMGFEEIVLAGVDFQFDPKEPHFYQSSSQELQRTSTSSIKNTTKMIASFRYCSNVLKESRKSKIISVSPHHVFDFVEYKKPEELNKH